MKIIKTMKWFKIVKIRKKIMKLYLYCGDILSEKEKQIIEAYYNNDIPMTIRQIAQKMNCSRQLVSNIRKKALIKLEEEKQRRKYKQINHKK